jgi:SAM-dependent methyltransferase
VPPSQRKRDGTVRYDAAATAAFFDAYGEREWTRFDDGRTAPTSLAVHTHYLRRFVRAGDVVLDAGAGPGRFTIELARLGADVVVADISPGQLELNREKVAAAGCEERVLERVVADVCDLAAFADATFDAVVCYGGALSYVVERAPDAAAELARVTRPGGHLLVSVMSLIGMFVQYAESVVEVARRDGPGPMEEVARSGLLPQADDYGHLPMKAFRVGELEELLAPHGEVVALSATGLLDVDPPEPELREALARIELDIAADPGAAGAGAHLLAVVRR